MRLSKLEKKLINQGSLAKYIKLLNNCDELSNGRYLVKKIRSLNKFTDNTFKKNITRIMDGESRKTKWTDNA